MRKNSTWMSKPPTAVGVEISNLLLIGRRRRKVAIGNRINNGDAIIGKSSSFFMLHTKVKMAFEGQLNQVDTFWVDW